MKSAKICRACLSRLPLRRSSAIALDVSLKTSILPARCFSYDQTHFARSSGRSSISSRLTRSLDKEGEDGIDAVEDSYGEDIEQETEGMEGEEDVDGEAYDADDLEKRIRRMTLDRMKKFKDAAKARTEDQEEELPQEDYNFNLEEPELDPRVSYGMKKPEKVRPAYPVIIKLKPDLDPEVDADLLEQRRQEGILRRQVAAKRSAKGDFQDHIKVKVRGGRGGAGVASFGMTRDGKLGAPAGGNGGPGGAVYIQATTNLTSLHTLPRRFLADQGRNGGRDVRHGQAGDDLLISVPVGTVVTEISREGDEEAQWARMEEMGIPLEDRKWDRWERWFHISNSDPFSEDYYTAAERLLRREKKWATRTPTFEEKPPVVLDLDQPSPEPILLAPGGTGGMGNPFFTGIVGYRQPRFSSRGLIPYTSTFEFELKILADVGLVGFPNAGKSTILRALTGRRAEVAGYQFTTLNPQIGVVRVWDDGTWNTGSGSNVGESGVVEESWKEKQRDKEQRLKGDYKPLQRAPRKRDLRSIDQGSVDEREKIEAYRFTISDNPGLLPQASENVGLGHSFLRSIERSLALAYVLDLSRPDPAQDFKGLKEELENYKEGLSGKAAVVVLNKGDEEDKAIGKEKFDSVKRMVEELEEDGKVSVIVISGKYGLGLDKLVNILGTRVEEARAEERRLKEEKEREKEETQGGLMWSAS